MKRGQRSKGGAGSHEKRGKGPASRQGIPHQRDDGSWEQTIRFGGSKYSRSGATSREVRDRIAALRVELNDPQRRREAERVRDLGPTLAELCETALARHEQESGTRRVYGYALARWRRELGDDTRQREITRAAVQAAADALATTLEPSSVATYYAILRTALGAEHPALTGIALPRADDDDDEHDEIVPRDLAERLLAASRRDPSGIAIGLGLYAGLRAGEAAALRWVDVDLVRGSLSINGSTKPGAGGWVRGSTKNRKARRVHINADFCDWLDRHQRIQADTATVAGYPVPAFVLASLTTGAAVPRTEPVAILRRLLMAVCTPGELATYGELRYHALRHTHISALLAGGAGPADVAARTGHKVATMLETYAHAMPGNDLRLAAMAGEIFTLPPSQAAREAASSPEEHQDAAQSLVSVKLGHDRSEPQAPAGSTENRDRTPPKHRSTPQEPAPTSRPVSRLLSRLEVEP